MVTRQKVLEAVDDALLDEMKRRFGFIADQVAQGGAVPEINHWRATLAQLKEFHAAARVEAAAIFTEDEEKT